MKTVNATLFKVMHKLNDCTSKWLKQAKETIKENGIDCITYNDNNDIQFEYADAQPKYSKEVEAQIAKIKAENEPINKGEKITKVVVKGYSKNEDNIATSLYNFAITQLATQQSNKSLANAAAKVASAVAKR
jgi:hypothetical protein